YAEGSSRVRARRGAGERDRDTEMRRVQRERAAAQHEGQREDRPPRDERTDHRAPGNGRGAPGNGAPQRERLHSELWTRLTHPTYGRSPTLSPAPTTPCRV